MLALARCRGDRAAAVYPLGSRLLTFNPNYGFRRLRNNLDYATAHTPNRTGSLGGILVLIALISPESGIRFFARSVQTRT